jgi:hypothetical protein
MASLKEQREAERRAANKARNAEARAKLAAKPKPKSEAPAVKPKLDPVARMQLDGEAAVEIHVDSQPIAPVPGHVMASWRPKRILRSDPPQDDDVNPDAQRKLRRQARRMRRRLKARVRNLVRADIIGAVEWGGVDYGETPGTTKRRWIVRAAARHALKSGHYLDEDVTHLANRKAPMPTSTTAVVA